MNNVQRINVLDDDPTLDNQRSPWMNNNHGCNSENYCLTDVEPNLQQVYRNLFENDTASEGSCSSAYSDREPVISVIECDTTSENSSYYSASSDREPANSVSEYDTASEGSCSSAYSDREPVISVIECDTTSENSSYYSASSDREPANSVSEYDSMSEDSYYSCHSNGNIEIQDFINALRSPMIECTIGDIIKKLKRLEHTLQYLKKEFDDWRKLSAIIQQPSRHVRSRQNNFEGLRYIVGLSPEPSQLSRWLQNLEMTRYEVPANVDANSIPMMNVLSTHTGHQRLSVPLMASQTLESIMGRITLANPYTTGVETNLLLTAIYSGSRCPPISMELQAIKPITVTISTADANDISAIPEKEVYVNSVVPCGSVHNSPGQVLKFERNALANHFPGVMPVSARERGVISRRPDIISLCPSARTFYRNVNKKWNASEILGLLSNLDGNGICHEMLLKSYGSFTLTCEIRLSTKKDVLVREEKKCHCLSIATKQSAETELSKVTFDKTTTVREIAQLNAESPIKSIVIAEPELCPPITVGYSSLHLDEVLQKFAKKAAPNLMKSAEASGSSPPTMSNPNTVIVNSENYPLTILDNLSPNLNEALQQFGTKTPPNLVQSAEASGSKPPMVPEPTFSTKTENCQPSSFDCSSHNTDEVLEKVARKTTLNLVKSNEASGSSPPTVPNPNTVIVKSENCPLTILIYSSANLDEALQQFGTKTSPNLVQSTEASGSTPPPVPNPDTVILKSENCSLTIVVYSSTNLDKALQQSGTTAPPKSVKNTKASGSKSPMVPEPTFSAKSESTQTYNTDKVLQKVARKTAPNLMKSTEASESSPPMVPEPMFSAKTENTQTHNTDKVLQKVDRKTALNLVKNTVPSGSSPPTVPEDTFDAKTENWQPIVRDCSPRNTDKVLQKVARKTASNLTKSKEASGSNPSEVQLSPENKQSIDSTIIAQSRHILFPTRNFSSHSKSPKLIKPISPQLITKRTGTSSVSTLHVPLGATPPNQVKSHSIVQNNFEYIPADSEIMLYFARGTLINRNTEVSPRWENRGPGTIKIISYPTIGEYRLLLRQDTNENFLPFCNIVIPKTRFETSDTNLAIMWDEGGRNAIKGILFKDPFEGLQFLKKIISIQRMKIPAPTCSIRDDSKTHALIEFASKVGFSLFKMTVLCIYEAELYHGMCNDDCFVNLWTLCGSGLVGLLQHKDTKELRMVMYKEGEEFKMVMHKEAKESKMVLHKEGELPFRFSHIVPTDFELKSFVANNENQSNKWQWNSDGQTFACGFENAVIAADFKLTVESILKSVNISAGRKILEDIRRVS